MIALLTSVFAASLLGSAHCAGMCGPLVVCSGAGKDATRKHRLRAAGAYQFGRLTIYCIIGAVAGLLGSGISEGGALFGLQRAAVWVAGSLLIGVGLLELCRVAGVWTPRLQMPNRIVHWLAAAHRGSMKFKPTTRAATVGLLSGLMPCGWLYAFALSAAATARVDYAVLVMAVFWAGSVPMLVLISLGSSAFFTNLMRRVPYATAVALIVAGLFTLSYRSNIDLMTQAAASDWSTEHSTKTQATDSDSSQSLSNIANHVDSLDHSEMPCCANDDSK